MNAPTLDRIEDENAICAMFSEEAANDPASAQCMRDRATMLAAAVIQRRASDLMARPASSQADIASEQRAIAALDGFIEKLA